MSIPKTTMEDLELIAEEQPHTEVGKLLQTEKERKLVLKESHKLHEEMEKIEYIENLITTIPSGEKMYKETLGDPKNKKLNRTMTCQIRVTKAIGAIYFFRSSYVLPEKKDNFLKCVREWTEKIVKDL